MNNPRVSALLLGVFLIVSFIAHKNWERNLYWGDSWGYYSYLPAIFIYQDLGGYEKTVEVTRKYRPGFEDPLQDPYGLYRKHPQTGKLMIKYTGGVAAMLAPFFAVSHAAAVVLGQESDGFSAIYNIGTGIGIIFWVCFGLYFLSKVLMRYFDPKTTLATGLVLVLGTNLYYNTVLNSIMSHGLLFALYGILIYLTDTYYRHPERRYVWLIGLVGGMIVWVRPNEIYCMLIPALWGVGNFGDLKNRIKTEFSKMHWWLMAAVIAFIVLTPQFIYWKMYAGEWIYDGYVGEKFNFRRPHLIEGVFGFNNGWLVWTPIMFLAFPGWIASGVKKMPSFTPTMILTPLHIFIIYSWWCWNYINGFGSRPMEHMYPLLAFSLAAFAALFMSRLWSKLLLYLVFAAAIALTMFQVYQIKEGVLLSQEANRAYYWTVFGKTQSDHNVLITRMNNEMQPTNPTFVTTLQFWNFEDTATYKGASGNPVFEGRYSRRFQEQLTYLDTFYIDQIKEGDYLKISGACYYGADAPPFYQVWDTPYLFLNWKTADGKNARKTQSGIRPFQLIGNTNYSIYHTGVPNQWAPYYFYINIPHAQEKIQYGELGIWNPKSAPFYMDSLSIQLYKN